MGLLGLEGTRRVRVDDPRLPPKLRVALCAGGTVPHAVVFEVWTAHNHTAELHRTAGSDGVVVVVSNPRFGTFRHVACLVRSCGTESADGMVRYDLRQLFRQDLRQTITLIEHVVKSGPAWSELASVFDVHGRIPRTRAGLGTIIEATAGWKDDLPAPGVRIGPARLAEIKATRGDLLSAPPRCTFSAKRESPGASAGFRVACRCWGDWVILLAGGWKRPRHPSVRKGPGGAAIKVSLAEDDELEISRDDKGWWTMTLDNFFELCDSRRIFHRLRTEAMRTARIKLLEMSNTTDQDATSILLQRLTTSKAEAFSDAALLALGNTPTPCLNLESTAKEYEEQWKYDKRWFINRVCSGLVAKNQVRLAELILERIDAIGTTYVEKTPKPQRRASKDKHRSRMQAMRRLRSNRPPTCAGCSVSCAANCAPEGMGLFPGVGPVDIIIEKARRASEEDAEIEAAMLAAHV